MLSYSKKNKGFSTNTKETRFWTKYFQVNSFSEVILPFFYIAKVFGYFPFSLTKLSDSSARESFYYRTNCLDIFLFLINITINLTFLYAQAKLENMPLNSSIMQIGAQGVLIYSTVIIVVSSLMILFFRKEITSIVAQITRVDQEVKTYF